MESIVELSAEGPDIYEEYIRVPMYVDVDSILDLESMDNGNQGFMLTEKKMASPYRKVYEDTEDSPIPRNGRWDLSNWGFFAARKDGVLIGGCVVAMKTEQIHMLEGRSDMAVLWDIRVHPQQKHLGIGTKLFQMARGHAEAGGCNWMKIETQNVNVSACRFYRRQGCHLGGIVRHAYREYPEEVQLLWYLPLSIERTGGT